MVIVTLAFLRGAIAATVDWSGILVMENWYSTKNTMEYVFGGVVQGEGGGRAEVFSLLYGHVASGDVYLKHQDFSGESMNPTFNWWAVALYGEIVSDEIFDSLVAIEDFYGDDISSGGTLIENPNDFYMAFKVGEVLNGAESYEVGQTWYGWVHVSLDDNLYMTLIGAGVNLDGGAVIVGEGATPEPASGLLLLVGGALLALKRRRNMVQSSVWKITRVSRCREEFFC